MCFEEACPPQLLSCWLTDTLGLRVQEEEVMDDDKVWAVVFRQQKKGAPCPPASLPLPCALTPHAVAQRRSPRRLPRRPTG